MGAGQRHCMLTPVERVTSCLVSKKPVARTKEQADNALKQALHEIERTVHAITRNAGTTLRDDQQVDRVHAAKLDFATPPHPRERVTNENANGVIRPHRPEGSSRRHRTHVDGDVIAAGRNDRPRSPPCAAEPTPSPCSQAS